MKILKIKVDASPEALNNLDGYASDCRFEIEPGDSILDRQWADIIAVTKHCREDFKRDILPKLKTNSWNSSKVDDIATRLSECQKEAKDTLKLKHSPEYARAVSVFDRKILEALRYLDTLY